MIPSITESTIFATLGDFLESVLPANTPAIIGQTNRVASPEGDYCVMWMLTRPRLGTNFNTPADSKFTASIAGTTMTVTAFDPNLNAPIVVGSVIFSPDVATGTQVTALGTGTGGVGTYTITPSQTVGSETMSAGSTAHAQSTEVVIQIDVHGPNSGNNVQVIEQLFRDEYAVEAMDGSGVTPLYSDDPRQQAFTTAAAQYEERWTIDVHLQVTPTVSTPEQFADSVDLTVVNVNTLPTS